MALTYEPFDTITVSKVNEKLGGGIEAVNREISNLEAKISALKSKIPTNAATQDYVNTKVADYLPLSGGTLTGEINANNHRIYGLPMPITDTDAVNKQYVDNKTTIITNIVRFPIETINAYGDFHEVLPLPAPIPLNKFISASFASNTGLMCSYSLSVNDNKEIEHLDIMAHNFTSTNITTRISVLWQVYS